MIKIEGLDKIDQFLRHKSAQISQMENVQPPSNISVDISNTGYQALIQALVMAKIRGDTGTMQLIADELGKLGIAVARPMLLDFIAAFARETLKQNLS